MCLGGAFEFWISGVVLCVAVFMYLLCKYVLYSSTLAAGKVGSLARKKHKIPEARVKSAD